MSTIRSHPFPLRKFLIRGLAVITVLMLIGYFLYQARFLLLGPQLTLLTPSPGVHTEQIVTVEGYVSNISRLSLNGRAIYTNRSGYFREPLVLEHGYTIMTVEAEDRFGRTVAINRPFVYIPASLIN